MIWLVGIKLKGQDCWHKGLVPANFICNDFSCDEFLFYFVMSTCLIPTQDETHIVLFFDAKEHRILCFKKIRNIYLAFGVIACFLKKDKLPTMSLLYILG